MPKLARADKPARASRTPASGSPVTPRSVVPRALLAAVFAAAVSWAATLGEDPERAEAGVRPNIVVIQTDDQTRAQLTASYLRSDGVFVEAMPNTLGLIRDRGVTFTRYYVSDPLCCPSRATLLTGQYDHNHGVKGNFPPLGGYPALDKFGTVANWLQAAGYRTIHVGKFLNLYGEVGFSDPTEVPPGWSSWHTLVGEEGTHYFYGYRLNDNGRITGPYGDKSYEEKDEPSCPESPPPVGGCNHQTDLLTQRAVQAIHGSSGPFFLNVDYVAPHGDFRPPIGPEPAPRHYDSFVGAPLPRPPGWNEENVADKPSYVRNVPPLTPSEVMAATREWQKSLESLRDVDAGVEDIVAALSSRGLLRNTYIFVTSDNGFFFGEHRFSRAKFLPYEPATHVPLLIRGPGIPQGVRTGEISANIDIAPTIAALTGARPNHRLDGRSLLRFARDTSLRTRRPILMQAFTRATDVTRARRTATASAQAPARDYVGIRVGPYKFVSYANGEKELYDFRIDPHELRSVHLKRSYAPVRNFLAGELERLRFCRGRACKRPIVEPLAQPRVSAPTRR